MANPTESNEPSATEEINQTKSNSGLSHYVGVGASAGGLEAIEEFFKNMSPKSGLAFIVVQHLSPDYKSLMVELLSKHTEMKIFRAEDSMKIQPDCIYLIPPKKNLSIFHGTLLLSDQDQARGINLPIDIFLRSLAEDQAEKAIAIILSGTGSDGTRGVRAIKENGGMVMVQDEETAKFDGMPRSAISTGLTDFILSPKEMPKQLLSYIKHPYASKSEYSESILTDEDGLTRIFSLLREKHKIDFTYYKPSTVVRRIERRMSVNQIHELRDYVKFMQSYTKEVSALYREILIGVTSFFRDPDAFQLLEDHWLPKLLRDSPSRKLRFWVTACSTGEEAYSLAILAMECMEKMEQKYDIKIFATDIDDAAIVKAGSGIYPESITADLSPNLLAKYFYRKDDNFFHVSRQIREMVVFAKHNLIKDPPFTQINLVSCRNLLIYLQPNLQKRVMELLNYSLIEDGILFLGTSESISDMTDCFETIDHKWKLYRSRGKRRMKTAFRTEDTLFTPASGFRRTSIGQKQTVRLQEEERVLDQIVQLMAEDFFTCAFVINEQLELLHVLGKSEGYLTFPPGKVFNDVSKMVIKELSIPLSTGVQRLFKNRENISYSNIRIQKDGKPISLQIRIKLVPEKRNQELMALVLIEEIKKSDAGSDADSGSSYDIGKEAEQRIFDLEHELQFSRENLQATIEELETSNEELQATNEELLASNEELQSTNEELQSVNEELFTVNAEHQKKIMELTDLNNDINNLLSSSQTITIFLDENCEVRRFTPMASKLFKILDSDIGRPFTHLSHNLIIEDLPAIVQTINKSQESVEQEVESNDGACYLMRVLPYFISPQVASGVVLTLTDITKRKAADEEIRFQATVLNNISEAVITTDTHFIVKDWNEPAERLYGWKKHEVLGKDLIALIKTDYGKESQHSVLKTLHEHRLWQGEVTQYRKDGQPVYIWEAFSAIEDDKRNLIGFVTVNRNITALKKSNKALQASEQRHRQLFDLMAQGVVYQDAKGNITSANAAAIEILGLSLEQMQGRTSMDPRWKSIREDGSEFPGSEHPAMISLKTGKPVNDVVMGVFHPQKNQHRWININAVPLFSEGSETPREVFATFDDFTELKNSREHYRLLFEKMVNGFAYHKIICDDSGKPVDYTFLEINSSFEEITGLKKADVIGKRVTEVLPEIGNDPFDWISEYGKVAQTGVPIRLKQYSKHLDKWFQISAYSPMQDYFVVIFAVTGDEDRTTV